MSRNNKGPGKHQMKNLTFDRYGGEMPSFLKKLIGETPEAKAERRVVERDEDEPEREDEAPTVVVLGQGDLTADEVAAIKTGSNPAAVVAAKSGTSKREAESDHHSENDEDDGVVKFRKPTKKSKSSSGAKESRHKRKKGDQAVSTDEKKVSRRDVKAVNNRALLSFDDGDVELS